jgi:hypothetical protein
MVIAALVLFLDNQRIYFCFSCLDLFISGLIIISFPYFFREHGWGGTLLTVAAQKKLVVTVEQLLVAGADIESKDKVTGSVRRDELWS